MIDDQPSYTEALAMAFGFEERLELVGKATTTNAGVRIALELQPDLVLCDYRMPGDSSGTECAARLREYGFDGQIVILTGAVAPHVHAEAERIAGVEVLSKMLNVDEIIENITAGDASTMVGDPSANNDPWTLAAMDAGPPSPQRSPLVQLMCLGLITIGFLAAAAFLLNGSLQNAGFLNGGGQNDQDATETSTQVSSRVTSSEVSPADPDAGTSVAGTVLERPFVIIDGDGGPLRVSVSIDGVEVDSFVPSNLPATVALEVAASTAVRVAVENVGGGGTKSCSIGAARRVFDTNQVGAEGPAVCSAVLAN